MIPIKLFRNILYSGYFHKLFWDHEILDVKTNFVFIKTTSKKPKNKFYLFLHKDLSHDYQCALRFFFFQSVTLSTRNSPFPFFLLQHYIYYKTDVHMKITVSTHNWKKKTIMCVKLKKKTKQQPRCFFSTISSAKESFFFASSVSSGWFSSSI